ncbi:MAG: type II secretion system F family protein [Phycisphaerales bacterium]|nr:type II secretion system F family protein [Phycisphaerales bacterium]
MAASAFKYTAINEAGERVRGRLQGSSEDNVYEQLSRMGNTPLKISECSSGGSVFTQKKITKQEIAALTREMSVLVEANIPIARGLFSIAEHEKNRLLKDMILDIASMIESGSRITESFGKYQHVFGEVYIETLKAAEKSGKLGVVMTHLSDMLERNIETAQQVRRALAYPIIVMCFVALALGVITIFVVPKFATIFETNGVELPLMTRLIRAIGISVKGYWWAYGSGVLAAVLGLRAAWKNERGRYRLEVILHKLPYIGNMFTAVTTARFSRVMSIGLESGIDVIESLMVAGMSTGRPVFIKECEMMCDQMRVGSSLEEVINKSHGLPSFARRLFGAGKDSAELARSGNIIARHYDRLSDHLAKNINTIVEPMMTIAMACIVLIVALSVFLPMWQMIKINK